MASSPQNMSAKAQEAMGLPPGFKAYSPFPFGGMNVQASPIALQDNEFTWVENFLRLGDGNLRTAWDAGVSIYSSGNVIYYSFYTIGTTRYCMVFLKNGGAVQINRETGFRIGIGPSLSFYDKAAPANVPFAKAWGTQYLLISNNNTPNDYWAWDGTLLYFAGSAAPGGVSILSGGFSYTSAPTVTVFGGSGSGMAITPVISGGQVVELNITNPGVGYEIGDVVQVAFSGGGSSTTPILTASLTSGSVGGATITAPGAAYTSPVVAFSGGGGTGATATATQTGGLVTAIAITNPGSGYTSAPTMTITDGGPGAGATAVAVLGPSGVASVAVVNGGTGFTSVPLITFVGGAGAGATGIAVLTGTSIAAVNLTASGSGYTSAPSVALVGGNPTITATATAILVGDAVGQVQITNAGSDYSTPVEVTFTGGGGVGAGATVLFTPTSIASVTVSSTGQYYTTAPAVQVAPGANNSAYASVALMPFGVSGSAMETYLSRVWIVDPAPSLTSITPPGGEWSVSAPGSFIDFATSDGGVAALNTDAFLQTRYTNVRQSSGYLYFFGDGSVSVVSNVSTSGTPTTTVYNYQNVDPQSGAEWRDSIQDFGRSAILANATGIYGLYGGTTSKISQKLDQIFTPVSQGGLFVPPSAGGLTPTSAVATIFNVKHYLLLLTLHDPDSGLQRNVMLTWNEKDWVITSQSVPLTSITTEKVDSTYTAFGCDGANIYPLFATPSTKLTKRFDTKQYGADRMFIQKETHAVWMQAQDYSVGSSGVSGTFTLVTSGIGIQNARNPSGQSVTSSSVFNIQPSFEAPYPYWPLWGTSMKIYFVTCSLRFSTTAPDFTLGNLVIGYGDKVAYFGQ